jgi:hypothetical protein
VLFVLAVATARILSPLLRGLERAARRAPAAFRTALLSLARAPGEVALAVVFFVVSIGIAVFAIAYRATLVQGERDQARFAVPAPYVLQEDLTRLVTIQQAAPRLAGARVYRDDATVNGTDTTMLALPPSALAHIDGWRHDFAAQSPAQLAAAITPQTRMQLRGAPVPSILRFTIAGDRIGLALVVQNPAGDFTQVDLGEHGPGTYARPTHLRAGKLIALRLSFPTIAAYVASHKEAETSQVVADASVGTLRLGGALRTWIASGGVRVERPGVFRYVVNRAADSLIEPQQPSIVVPVVASPDLGRIGKTIALRVADTVVPATIVATTRYFPSVDGNVVVADLGAWLTTVNALEPGVATASEIWTDRAPPALPLQVTSQRVQLRRLERDPIARGATALLAVVAVVALILAVAALVLTVLGDRSGERASLADLEAQGLTPRERRRHLLLRAATVGALGLGGGLGAGVLVGLLVVAVVTVTAGAQQALPPLALSFDWALVGVALAALVAAGAVGAAGATRR